MKQREAFVTNCAIGLARKLHTKILRLMIEWLGHHRPLRRQHILQPPRLHSQRCALCIQEAKASPTRRPRRFQHQFAIALQQLLHLVGSRTLKRLTQRALALQQRQEASRRAAMRQQADIVQLSIRGQQAVACPHSLQLTPQGFVPPPRLYVRQSRCRHPFFPVGCCLLLSQRMMPSTKAALHRLYQAHIVIVSTRGILHQHTIALFSPQGRDEPQVVTQLSPSMWRREITEVGSESYIVFRIKNM